MTRTLLPGVNDNGENGFILIRGLLIMFIVLLCFASLLAGMTVFSHRSAVLLEQTEREIQNRNELIKGIIN